MARSESGDPDEKKTSRRPPNNAFRQQRLKAWQPILTPKSVIPIFLALGVILTPIGGLFLYANFQVQELAIDYTHCATQAPRNELAPMNPSLVTAHFKTTNASIDPQWKRQTVNHTYNGDYVVQNLTNCTIQFSIPENIKPPVLFYYRLTNFYQNHRRYVTSYYDTQLAGNTGVDVKSTGASSCDPLDTVNGKMYYPCGLIANSMFNDTFGQPVALNIGNPNTTYVMNDTDIAWESDMAMYSPSTNRNASTMLPPPNWQIRYRNGQYTNETLFNPHDEHFAVWMRTAGLPDFNKFYMHNDVDVMKQGTYSIDIISNFDAAKWDGTKSFVITTKTVLGGRNPFLGILYIVVGGVCLVFSIFFAVMSVIKPRKLGDHTHLSWNQAPKSAPAPPGPAVGTSTGRDFA